MLLSIATCLAAEITVDCVEATVPGQLVPGPVLAVAGRATDSAVSEVNQAIS